MSPEEFANRHPFLYHITWPQAVPGIERHGLLSTSRLLALYELPQAQRDVLEGTRRPQRVTLTHPLHGEAIITDNIPLSEAALAACLDDGLKPKDWLRVLNRRVFFWADEKNMEGHLSSRAVRGLKRVVLTIDTLRLVTDYHDRVELSAINTGSTIRRPARRGLKTFSPVAGHTYAEWTRLRGGKDKLKEVAVVDGIPDVMNYVTARREVIC